MLGVIEIACDIFRASLAAAPQCVAFLVSPPFTCAFLLVQQFKKGDRVQFPVGGNMAKGTVLRMEKTAKGEVRQLTVDISLRRWNAHAVMLHVLNE